MRDALSSLSTEVANGFSTSEDITPSTTTTLTYVATLPPIVRRSSLKLALDLPHNVTSSALERSRSSHSLRSARSSPAKDILEQTRRNSVSRLPRPEPSPRREPPITPKPRVRHYPLPAPSYAEGMISLSRRMRNRSQSPAPNYAELGVSSRPELVSVVLGRPTPSRDMIRMSLCGSAGTMNGYSRNI